MALVHSLFTLHHHQINFGRLPSDSTWALGEGVVDNSVVYLNEQRDVRLHSMEVALSLSSQIWLPTVDSLFLGLKGGNA